MSSEVLEFIKKHNLKIQDLANVAINSKKPFGVLNCARLDVKGEMTQVLQEEIIKLENPLFIYYFARDIKGADSKKLMEVVKKLGLDDKARGYIYMNVYADVKDARPISLGLD